MLTGPSHRTPRRVIPCGAESLRLEWTPVRQLKQNPNNPRLHSARQIKQLASSITAFGFNVPILIDPHHNVIAGHGRVEAVKQLGWTKVPTLCLSHLSAAQARGFALADNRLCENSSWDESLLAEELKSLSMLDLNFSLDATGFEIGEIDLRLQVLDATEKPSTDPDDVLQAIATGPAVSRPGDLWQAGRHKISCGDALDPKRFAHLMDGEVANLVFADPPYNVKIDGHASGNGAVRHREFAMASGEMTGEEFAGFLALSLGLAASYCVNGSLHFVCMDWRHSLELLTAARDIYDHHINTCVWVKNQAGMGSFYRSQQEFIHVFKVGSAPHRNNIDLGRHGRNRSNVWQYPSANTFSRTGEEGNLLAIHPTVKPVGLVADALLDSTARSEIVLDPFLGSGTTLIAAERTGRRCFGIEIDPLYVDAILRRWQAHTGDDARNIVTGMTFRETEGNNA